MGGDHSASNGLGAVVVLNKGQVEARYGDYCR
jgi:hypothetical protein